MPPSPRRPARHPRRRDGWPTEAWLTFLVAGLPPLVFWTATSSVFSLPKLTVAAILAVGLVAVRWWRMPPAPAGWQWNPTLLAVGVFLLLAFVATIGSDAPMLSLAGHLGRNTGVLAYTLGALLLVVVGTSTHTSMPVAVAAGAGVASSAVSAYALAQAAGVDPVAWARDFADIGATATVGNPNYVGAHAAIGVGIAAGLFLHSRTVSLRAAGIAMAALCTGGVVVSGALQGVLASGAAVVVAAVVALVRRRPDLRRLLGVSLAVMTAGGATALGVGAAGHGPLAFVAGRPSTQFRLWDWQAALAIADQHPWAGVGFDRFGAYAQAARPPAAADVFGPGVGQGAAHNVPLTMLASGGWPLVVAYLAVIVLTAWALVRGVRDAEGGTGPLLASLAGGWTAYQVQALVSIDVPSLLLTHWLLAGAIVAVGAPRFPLRVPRRVERVPPRGVAVGAAGAAGLLLLAPSGLLLAADVAAGEGERARAQGRVADAIAATERATSRAAFEPGYHDRLGLAHIAANDGPAALAAFQAGIDADHRALSPHLNAARLTALLGDAERSARLYQVVLELEPNNVALYEEAVEPVTVAAGPGGLDRLLEQLVTRRSDSADAWALAAQVRDDHGLPGASMAARQALHLDPDHDQARRLDTIAAG